MSKQKTRYSGKRFTLEGELVSAFQDNPQFLLSAGLNETDPEAIRINANLPELDLSLGAGIEGGAAPKVALLRDAKISDDSAADGAVFANALIVPEGAAIEFVLGCRSTVGFGFSLKPTSAGSGMDGHSQIVDRLFGVSSPAEDGYRYEIVRRFQDDSADLLLINAAGSYKGGAIKSEDRAGRWVIQASVWDVKSYIDPITSQVYSEKRLPQVSQQKARARSSDRYFGEVVPAVSMLSSLPPFSGVAPGVLVGGGSRSEQTFNPIRVLKEGDAIGALTLTLFVA